MVKYRIFIKQAFSQHSKHLHTKAIKCSGYICFVLPPPSLLLFVLVVLVMHAARQRVTFNDYPAKSRGISSDTWRRGSRTSRLKSGDIPQD